MTAILIDAEFVDHLAFDFIVNFERMLGRRIPKADFVNWLDCLCLDGGLRPGKNKVNVSLLHEKTTQELSNFETLKGNVKMESFMFGDALGEFDVQHYAVEPQVTDKATFFVESYKALADMKEVERIIVVADWEEYGKDLAKVVSITTETIVFVMELFRDRRFYVENLGFSLAHALGIRGEELD